MLRKNTILGVEIINASESEVLEYVFDKLAKPSEKFYVVTPNPEIVVHASKDKEYRQILNQAEIAIPDGIGIILAAKFLGKPLKERISGIDLMEKICAKSVGKPISIGLLGARPGVAEKAADCLKKKYPHLKIVFAGSEWSEEGYQFPAKYKVASSKYQVIKKLHTTSYMLPATNIDILFVAFGAPKQEMWIAENLPKLPVKAAMGVGGAFDILSGDIRRAPEFLRSIGLEWLYRLFREPWRWKRQLALIEFTRLILAARYGAKH